jgi:hypothetical protein
MGGNVIPPEFGVPLEADQLSSSIPTSILYGVTPSNQFIPIQITETGELVVEATFSGSITIGEVGVPDESGFTYGTSLEQPVGGVYQDTSPTLSVGETGAVRLTEYRAFHVNLRDSSGVEIDPATEATQLSVLADLNQFQFSSGALIVTSTGVAGTPVNQYAENATVPSGILTAILSYTVPASKTLSITGAYGWGTYNGEYLIQVDGATVGGGWTSAASINFHGDYISAPIPATTGQIVTINVTQYGTSTQDFKANLLGTLN